MNQFGRLIAPSDGRDFRYLARMAMPQIATLIPKPRVRAYTLRPVLDQGMTPKCCAYSAQGFLEAAPLMSKHDGLLPDILYTLAQDNDEWPGANYDGTSVRGTMKALSIMGHIKSYAWALTTQEMTTWCNHGYGTCLVGTNWYAEMSNVDRAGFMIEPASSLATPIGGHAWHVIWYDAKKGGFLMRNSWGAFYGILDKRGAGTGLAYVRPEFMARLIVEAGEVACPTQVKLKPVVI